ncbi:MAG: bifunctional NADP-dependent methylenetetrahydromethanopterin dehydrogenase/methylenetetrahydrofolate dehydrogenase [Planctomycetaceae bacterium]|nr:bifunctional NADP-dependent methylenetetrahydromethanopterin dehydrogenase/methylenetetrahydrofolate dehydrogenase [Planctomycetaceae bacterium]
MTTVKNILLQLDTDSFASSFDAVVAVDSGVDSLCQYSNVTEENVTGLVHGAMFTRSPSKLKHTAIFIGGSNVDAAESVYRRVLRTFFGPMRVSVVMDANGCNTTSVAAVESGFSGLSSLSGMVEAEPKPIRALIMGGTGPVGQRVATLLLDRGCEVVLHSRSAEKAQTVIERLPSSSPKASIGFLTKTGPELEAELASFQFVVNAGAAGVQTLNDRAVAILAETPGVIVDLNAVPPTGVAGIAPHDQAKPFGRRLGFGSLAVGVWKMKLHRAVIQACFRANDQVFNLREIANLSSNLMAEEMGSR